VGDDDEDLGVAGAAGSTGAAEGSVVAMKER
jgi:hypothetical protein